MRYFLAILTLVSVLLIASCDPRSMLPSQKSLDGKWTGTYSNVAVTDGVILVEFYGDGTGAIIDLQNGEQRSSGPVTLVERDIEFGIVTESDTSPAVKGTLNTTFTRIEGILTVNYFLHGTVSGPVNLRKGEGNTAKNDSK